MMDIRFQPWQLLRTSAVQAAVWFDLARDYGQRDLRWQAGYAARQALRCDAAMRSQLDALDIGAWQDASAGDALLGRAQLPQASALAKRFAAAVQEHPDDWLTWLYLARLQEMRAAQRTRPLRARPLDPGLAHPSAGSRLVDAWA
jgi:hypothetical protein